MEDPTEDLSGFFKSVLEAIHSRNWGLLVVLALIACMSVLRKFGGPIPRVGDFLSSRVGGWLSLFAMSVLVAAGAAIMASTPVSWALIASAVGVGFTTAGGYQAVKDLSPAITGWFFSLFGIADPIEVTPIRGSIGRPTPQQVAAFEEMMRETGFVKQPDGSWTRAK